MEPYIVDNSNFINFEKSVKMLFLCIYLHLKAPKSIVTLNKKRFKDSVLYRDTNDIWLVLYSSKDYANHLKVYENFEDSFNIGKYFLRFAFLDVNHYKRIKNKYNLSDESYLLIYHLTGNDYFPADNMTGKEIINYAASFIPDYSTKEDISLFSSDTQTPICCLFTDKSETPSLWRAISHHFHLSSSVRIATSSNRTLASKFNVSTFPSIIFKNLTHSFIYTGRFEFHKICKYIELFLGKRYTNKERKVKVYPLDKLYKKCQSKESICIIHTKTELDNKFMEARERHDSDKLVFFYGLDVNNFPYMKENSIYALNPISKQYKNINDLSQIDEFLDEMIKSKGFFDAEL